MKQITFIFLALLICSMSYGQIRVITSGDVGIGTTTPVSGSQLTVEKLGVTEVVTVTGDNPGVRITVNNNHSNQNAGFRFSTGGIKKWTCAAFQANTAGSNLDWTFYNEQTGRRSLVIDGNTENSTFLGTVTASNGLLTGSDKRLKSNVKSYTGGLDKILRMNTVTFNYNDNLRKSDNREYIGVIAQELQEIEPAIVTSVTNYKVDEDLMQTGVEEEYLAIQTDAVQYMLVSAIQEQQKMIRDLQIEIEALKSGLSSTETKVDNKNRDFYLEQNNPNPHNGFTTINYLLPSNASNAKIVIYDMSGRMMKSYDVDTFERKGSLSIHMNEFNNGNYAFTLVVNDRVLESKIMTQTN